ncbi:MAG: SDR family oxidoreductase [Bdellovibrionaceae bacterium]|nr:SDR family oxidoreductase [Pseudobdellovibrionaceae bacterium]
MNTKLAIITGASSGIGHAIAQALHPLGYHLVLLGRNTERLKSVSTSLPGSEYYQCDLDDVDQVTKISSSLAGSFKDKNFNRVVLVNNAGVVSRMPFSENSMEEWQRQFQVNLFSPAILTQGLLPFLKDQKEARIINISSSLGLRPIPNTSIYSASKAALNSLTQALALELAPLKIPVNAICPGIVETPIQEFYQTEDAKLREQLNAAQPIGRIGQPEDIAKVVCFYAENASEWITGTLVPVDGGILLV